MRRVLFHVLLLPFPCTVLYSGTSLQASPVQYRSHANSLYQPEVSELIQEVLEFFRFNELVLACLCLAKESLPNCRHLISLYFDLQLCIWIGLAQTVSLPRQDLNFLPKSLKVSLYKNRIDKLATAVSQASAMYW